MAEKDKATLTHIGADGSAQMVDVTDRAITHRSATVEGKVLVSAEVRELIASNGVSKGNVIEIARIAAIMGAKKTPELIPLCHPIGISGMDVAVQLVDDGIRISAEVRTTDRTGVEMEAFTAVAVAGLTIVDMIKAADAYATITDIRLIEKAGGKNGHWTRTA